VSADGDNGDNDAVASQVPSVAEYLIAHLADACGVDEHTPGGRPVCNASAMGVELDDVAILRQQDLDLTVCSTHDLRRYSRVL
jgi:hypothetical protein